MKNLIVVLLLGLNVVVYGCHDHDHYEDPVTIHLQNYLRLKKKNPDSALIELKQHAKLAFKDHPKTIDWVELVSRLDRSGISSLPDMITLSQLNLQIAIDNGAPEEHIEILRSKMLVWQEIQIDLVQEKREPSTFLIEFSMRVDPHKRE